MNLTPGFPDLFFPERDKGFSLSSIRAGARVVSEPERYHRGIASFAIGRLENLNNTKNKELYYREISSSSFFLSPPPPFLFLPPCCHVLPLCGLHGPFSIGGSKLAARRIFRDRVQWKIQWKGWKCFYILHRRGEKGGEREGEEESEVLKKENFFLSGVEWLNERCSYCTKKLSRSLESVENIIV